MTDVHQDEFTERLQSLWTSGTQEVAVAFLRRAIRPEMSLRELAQTLAFEHANQYLDDIQLRDVLRRGEHEAALASAPAAAAAVNNAQPARERRRRRGPQEIEALREMVLERLRASMGSTTSAHLCEVLANGGHEIDALQMNRLLGQLEEQGYVTYLGGKPKAWRLKPAGRTAPEPMQIRRAAATTLADSDRTPTR